MGEGDFLFLNFRGAITYNEGINTEDFYLDSIGLTKGAASSARISTNYYTEDDSVDGSRQSGSYNLSFNYPIGQVFNGNFLTFARGNASLSLSRSSISYFKEVETVDGCDSAVFEEKTTYSIYPSFL